MKPLETTVEEVLRNAIQSEVETRAYYQRWRERAARPRCASGCCSSPTWSSSIARSWSASTARRSAQSAARPAAGARRAAARHRRSRPAPRAEARARARARLRELLPLHGRARPATPSSAGSSWSWPRSEWKHKTDLQAEYDTHPRRRSGAVPPGHLRLLPETVRPMTPRAPSACLSLSHTTRCRFSTRRFV